MTKDEYAKRIQRKARKPFDQMTPYERNEKKRQLNHLYNRIGCDDDVLLGDADDLWRMIEGILTSWRIEEQRETNEREQRVNVLKCMNFIMRNMEDERAYMDWMICGVPDGATDEDYKDIASDKANYHDITRWFFAMCEKYGDSGITLSNARFY